MSSRKLTLADIADLRAYEREREAFRERVIALKRIRRIAVGPVVTVLFESRDTIRFQVQEMARAERMLTDAAIQAELDIYNPLIPEPGQLSATLFIELTSDDELRRWLPVLVGVERSVRLVAGTPGAAGTVIPAAPEAAHAAQLTRDDVTASVHYLSWSLTPDEIEAVGRGPVALAIEHPSYRESTTLREETLRALREDLGTTAGV